MVIEHVTLIDGTGAAPAQMHTVILRGRKIQWVGPDAEAPLTDTEAGRIDGRGQFLLPGFIDSHVHLAMPAGQLSGTAMLHLPPRYGYYAAIPLLRATLDAGVTTVRDLGGIDMATEVAIERGLIEGPEIIFAYRALGPTGGHGDFRTCCGFNQGEAISPNGDIGFLTDGVDEALRNTREVMRLGGKVIKVMASGGVWSPRDTPWHDGLNIAEMRAIVEEAGSHGVPVAAHAQSARSISNALVAGVRSIEHGYEIDDQAIELMLAKDSFLVPTLSTGTIPPDPARAASYAVEKKLRLQEKLHGCVSKAISAGVKVALGTDAGVCEHGTNLAELGHLVDFGMSPMDALVAGTLNAAKLLQLEDRVGSIELGKDADLVLTNVDPLNSIHALADPKNIDIVFAKGRMVKDIRASVPAGVGA
ncbi:MULTISPECIES: metal-dependent hydrolase family protein [Paeniglutamicibacter]|uniref:Imidazolonepropionase-like amidohydrolase n=1 Tax=Paeniglutamicibacter sulfureus TaxID=43666 RepID=A0ABU2BPS2_9MICC|nr:MULTISPECIES: amidohydrolase family protein [Paeniglutamicibacter]MCV9996435.1 amidohydrolase family protein [Paeniglutamicibacter sp. ZC-3]MDO2935616.1 amidohydrolase family protein [Paeniglutamicibacter sulfureus]MDR7359984.1 imidazolonepropionase-like amidohydrolase [Paeniglutamicibacter sulfureus]